MYDNLTELLLEGKAGTPTIDSLPIAVYATDTEGRLKYFNSAAAKLSGRTPTLGEDKWCVSWKLFYPDGSPMPHNECPMALCLQQKRSLYGEEAIAERPDGSRFWFKAYPTPLHNRKGDFIGGINVLMDITDLKETEKQLRQNERELIDFFENATVGLRWVRPDGTVKRVNGTELDMLGYNHEEYIDKHISNFLANENEVEDILQKLSNGEELYDFETKLKCKDGSVRHVLVNSNVYRENGEFIHTRCITRDITRQKQAEAKLKVVIHKSEQQKRLYEAVISSTPDLVYIFDLNYRFIFANNALLEMWGLTKEESIGKNLLEVGYEPWHAEMHEREIDKVIATKQAVQGEVSFPHDKLGQRFYEYIFVPVIDKKGEVEAVAGTTRDITIRKKNEQALRKSEEKLKAMNERLEERVKERTETLLSYQSQLRSLASQLSKSEEKQRQRLATELHDNLGQLLAVGKMKIKVLQNENPTIGPRKAITDLEEVIENALSYTRELMTDLKPPPSISNDIRTDINWIAEKLEKRGLKVTIEDDNQPKPLNDEVQTTVLQSVRELFLNVIKHTTDKEATVYLQRKQDLLRVTVKDGGKGFDLNSKELSPDKDGKFGLFNIQERIDLLGGKVDIEAKKGRGTKVTLYVPLSKGAKVTKAVSRDKETGRNHLQPKQDGLEQRIKVLLVDDHQMVRKGFRKIIEEEEDIVIVGEASGGEEALKVARETSPDIVLMDINMPGMDGIEATRKITGEISDIRVIGLSLHDKKGVINDMRRAGASAYLIKSEAFESLILTIRTQAETLKR